MDTNFKCPNDKCGNMVLHSRTTSSPHIYAFQCTHCGREGIYDDRNGISELSDVPKKRIKFKDKQITWCSDVKK